MLNQKLTLTVLLVLGTIAIGCTSKTIYTTLDPADVNLLLVPGDVIEIYKKDKSILQMEVEEVRIDKIIGYVTAIDDVKTEPQIQEVSRDKIVKITTSKKNLVPLSGEEYATLVLLGYGLFIWVLVLTL